MTGFNIGLTDRSESLRINKSARALVGSLPLFTSSYRPIIDLLTPHIPSYMNEEITKLHEEEQTLIQRRRDLMNEYRTELKSIFQPILDNLPNTHPEFFI